MRNHTVFAVFPLGTRTAKNYLACQVTIRGSGVPVACLYFGDDQRFVSRLPSVQAGVI